jgi:hypothetical protein
MAGSVATVAPTTIALLAAAFSCCVNSFGAI